MDNICVGNCECEHISHMDKKKRTPLGNPSHKYGQKYYGLKAVKTPYGTFHICSDCINDCHRIGVKHG